MCGGAIISDIVAPASRSSTRLTANLLWGGAVAGMSKQKKNRGGYRSMPLRSAAIIDLEDEFEADFQDFKDYSDSEDVKRPFAFSASKSSGLKVEIIGGEISRNSEKKPRPEKEQALSCPRCKSTNTKFCYYNNYSLAQPRYFCKNCRRYWTHGGTLRNVPVGGSSRKNKRSSSSSSSSSINHHHRPSPRNPSFNGVPFMHNLNPQNPNSDRLSSLASAPVPDPDPVLMPSGSPMHELKGFENRFGDLQRPVQDGPTAPSRIGFPFEEAATVANFERDCNGFWSGMLYSGGSW